MQMAEKKAIGAAVVAGGDAAPVLELGEQIIDLVALTVESLVVGEGSAWAMVSLATLPRPCS